MKPLTTLMLVSISALLISGATAQDQDKKKIAFTAIEDAGPDYQVQGEYVGAHGSGEFGVQVVALGGEEFEAVLCPGGLPGAGWDGKQPRTRIKGKLANGEVVFEKDGIRAQLKDGKIQLSGSTLERVTRESETLGAEPPKGAVVLFDGTNAEGWEGGRITEGEEKLLMEGTQSAEKFGDHTLHIEFSLPYKPYARGQGRGNSGIYLQGRYEVQMLDSFGLTGESNECGGVYKIGKPAVNMCYPPLQWQTYDIEFKAAKWEGDKKTANASMTVHHNGILIHENLELPNSTTASKLKEGKEPGPVYLQNHGNPVRYRNIWVVKE